MAIYFITNTPKKLLFSFKKAIDEGRVAGWTCDRDDDFTLTEVPWERLAWFHPSVVEKERLILNIIRAQNARISDEVYAVYHDKFVQAVRTHCKDQFTSVNATPLPEGADSVV